MGVLGGWLDSMLGGIATIFVDGNPQPQEPILDLVAGDGVALTTTDLPTAGILQVTISATSSGGAFLVHTQDLTGLSGSVDYSGPVGNGTRIADLIVLTGSPSGSVWYVMPAAVPFNSQFLNRTGSEVQLGLSGGGSVGPVTFGGPGVGGSFFVCDGTVIAKSDAHNLGGGDVFDFPYIGGGFDGRVVSLGYVGAVNQYYSGQTQTVPVYGVAFNRQDAATWGVDTPAIGAGPTVTHGSLDWYTAGVGLVVQGNSGWTRTVAPEAQDPNVAWSTQASLEGPSAVGEIGAPFRDQLVGPSAASSVFPSLFPGSALSSYCSSTHARIICQCRVVSSSGATETAGDFVTFVQEVDYAYVAGTVVCVPGAQTQGSFSAVGGGAGTIASVTFAPSATGSTAEYSVSTPVTFDPSTVLDVQYHTDPTTL